MRTVVELAGISNILSKAHGSNNKINTAQAALAALSELRAVAEEAAGEFLGREADAGGRAGDQRNAAVEPEAVEDVHGSNCAVKTSLVSHCRQPRAARALLECGPFRGALQGLHSGPRLGSHSCNRAHPHDQTSWVRLNKSPDVSRCGFHHFWSLT